MKKDHTEFVGDSIAKKAIEKIYLSNLSILQKLELCELKAIVFETVKECLDKPENFLTDNQKWSIYNECRLNDAIYEITNYLDENFDPEYEIFPKNLIKDAAMELIEQEGVLLGDDYNQLIRDSLRITLKNKEQGVI